MGLSSRSAGKTWKTARELLSQIEPGRHSFFLKLAPAPSVIRCPRCRQEADRRRGLYYCPECGHVLEPEEDDLKPSEINCPFCLEPIPKKSGVCPQCSKALPVFGIETVKNRPCCRWCKTPVQTGQKFCRYCSAPLASGGLVP